MESVWDRHKHRYVRYSLPIVLILLVIGNVWLFSKVLRGGEHGVAVSPWELGSLLEGSEEKWQTPHTMLILGRAGEGNNAPYLTDSILILHADPASNEAKLLSLPRDLLVQTDDGDLMKLNALWMNTMGTEKNNFSQVEKKVSEITGLTIDETVVFDLKTLAAVIEKIDGVVVFVPSDINDPRFPTDTGGYETFSLKSGWRRLDSETALQFARTRHSENGDFDRVRRQQELIKGVKGKVATINPVWSFATIWSIYSVVQQNVLTTLTISDAKEWWGFAEGLSLEEIDHFVLNEESGLVRAHMIETPDGLSYVLSPQEEDPFEYATIRSQIQNFINKQ